MKCGIRFERVFLWIAVLATCAMIFFFSAQNGEESTESSGFVTRLLVRAVTRGFDDLPQEAQDALCDRTAPYVRKAAHFGEFALLGLLATLLCRNYGRRNPALWGWLASTAYAGTDEAHQLAVSQRAGTITDVAIDSSGALCGALTALLLALIVSRTAGKRGGAHRNANTKSIFR